MTRRGPDGRFVKAPSRAVRLGRQWATLFAAICTVAAAVAAFTLVTFGGNPACVDCVR